MIGSFKQDLTQHEIRLIRLQGKSRNPLVASPTDYGSLLVWLVLSASVH